MNIQDRIVRHIAAKRVERSRGEDGQLRCSELLAPRCARDRHFDTLLLGADEFRQLLAYAELWDCGHLYWIHGRMEFRGMKVLGVDEVSYLQVCRRGAHESSSTRRTS